MRVSLFVSLLVAVVAFAAPPRQLPGLGQHGRQPPGSSRLLQRVAPLPKVKGDITGVYKKIAPATVIIRIQEGYGSGVVISKDGLILTNHHVAVDGAADSLSVKVEVERGKLDADGNMQRLPDVLTAHVLKWDEEADVALLKLDAPPADLEFTALATKPTSPGAQVYSVGHGNVGLLWNFRPCNVTAVGFKNQIARFVIKPIGSATAPVENDKSSARVVQSTCTLSGGDSGGPLVNEAGEVVGLNDFVVPDRNISGSAAFFHVELKHLQELVKDAPTSAMRVVPSPWATAARAFLGDVDGDGRNDTLTLKGRGPLPVAIFVDPSQATSAGANARAVFDAKEFSVPVTISTAAATRTVQVGDVLYLFNGQATVAAFTMKGTTATPLPKEKWPASPFMLAAAADEARLKRIMPVVAPAQVVDGSEPAFLVPPTSPTKVADSVDLDGDDLIDAVAQETLLGVTLYVDPNSKLPAGEDADLSLFKPRMAVMVGPTDADLQYFFDADGDGVWNRAVRVSERDGEPRKVLRAEAFVDGKWVRTPEFEGRPRVSLAWLGVTPSQEERVFNLLTEGRPTLLAAEAIERRGPNPGLPNVLGDPDGLAVAIKGAAKTGELTLELQGDGFMGIAVTTAVKGPAPTSDALVRQLVKGTVRFAFLWLATDNGEWAMYDWNTDGKVDLAMMSTKADGINFALTAKGAGFVEGEAKGAFLQWKGFKAKPMQKAVREALVGAFEPKFIEAEK